MPAHTPVMVPSAGNCRAGLTNKTRTDNNRSIFIVPISSSESYRNLLNGSFRFWHPEARRVNFRDSALGLCPACRSHSKKLKKN